MLRRSSIIRPVPVTPTVELLSFDVKGTFSITSEAKSVLKGLEGPFYTVVLHGHDHVHSQSAKSTLLTLLVREWFRDTSRAEAAARFWFVDPGTHQPERFWRRRNLDGGLHTYTSCVQRFTALRWYGADGVFRGTVLLVNSEADVLCGPDKRVIYSVGTELSTLGQGLCPGRGGWYLSTSWGVGCGQRLGIECRDFCVSIGVHRKVTSLQSESFGWDLPACFYAWLCLVVPLQLESSATSPVPTDGTTRYIFTT